ncbi:pantetheine-phosphate adenylyltransferase [Nakamurella endophytica]|uniref:Phosphopantetheine adenylyltransferase n=1 Tax=Nakamurella endophytica TaxID=1748367 RepID=A0A917T159_9ACTN|nr:pantetheine-phosphate adenylyltransferase [Nakamurella endophytica]GGM06553.1 phosphopantetheine adenylyltransferase [Nakamurella endophytica]
MTHAVCPGSFDPPTRGHLDIVGRTARLFDRVTVAVLVNPDKQGLFDVAERMDLLRRTTAELGLDGVRIDSFTGLLVDYCTANGVTAIVKGLRAVSDFDYELQMAQMNKDLSAVDTLFMPASPEYSFLSSSLVKQVARLGGDVRHLLPDAVAEALAGKLGGGPGGRGGSGTGRA